MAGEQYGRGRAWHVMCESALNWMACPGWLHPTFVQAFGTLWEKRWQTLRWRSFVLQVNANFCKIILIFIWHWGTNIGPFKIAVIILSQKWLIFITLLEAVGAFAEIRKANVSFSCFLGPSVCPYGTTRLPLDGFSWNFIIVGFANLCQETSSLGKVEVQCQALYVKTCVHLWLL